MELDQNTENKIKETAFSYVEKARPDWNVPHLHAAVFYMKKLIKAEGGNHKILLPTIYLHDIGYAGMLSGRYTFEDNQKVKKDHMKVGAEMCRKILNELDTFSESEINEICRLVSIHDNLEAINNHEAQLVFEADSLAQIDVSKVKPNFDKENFIVFLDDFTKRRVPVFKTKTGKSILNTLLPKAKSYFD